eukprot:6173267-Amphidinium_carterae.2
MGKNEEVLRTVHAATSALKSSSFAFVSQIWGLGYFNLTTCASRDWVADLSCALLTESRWLTVGAFCRAVVAAWSLGYFALIEHMRQPTSLKLIALHSGCGIVIVLARRSPRLVLDQG